jgi:hypothetical protein
MEIDRSFSTQLVGFVFLLIRLFLSASLASLPLWRRLGSITVVFEMNFFSYY